MTYQPPTEPTQPPPQPYQDGGPLYLNQLGVEHPAPKRRRRNPLLIAVVATVGTFAILGGGYTAYANFIREDSGVAACKAMRDGGTVTGEASASDEKLTEAEYREVRARFEDSDKEKIREHGTALIDLAWQIGNLPEDEAMGAFAFIGPMGTHMAGLQTGCADEGIIVDLNRD